MYYTHNRVAQDIAITQVNGTAKDVLVITRVSCHGK